MCTIPAWLIFSAGRYRVQVLTEEPCDRRARCGARGELGRLHFSRALGHGRFAVKRSQSRTESLPFSELREETEPESIHSENRRGDLGTGDVYIYSLAKFLRTVGSLLQAFAPSAFQWRILDSDNTEEFMEAGTHARNSDLTVTRSANHTERSEADRKLTICILGSSVARGFWASNCLGWSAMLKDALKNQFGHNTVNMSVPGADVVATLKAFDDLVPRLKPDIVIISLSLGNEGMFLCPPSQRKQVQVRFENGIRQLIAKTIDVGARPVLGGVYPNGDSVPQTYELLKETNRNLINLGFPMLNWLGALDDGNGRWKSKLWADPSHPNTEGQRVMFECIDLDIFTSKSKPPENKL
ncbi:hypothetical protein NDN08_000568 [Rhodosorus marinus]|uniref:SGNH hydrolase-type esterase domain-containing protein n=1 Tax=Rhodosorus marinus TaxID=101924 RepID=A0AAV8UNH4_9RHOD|nr:hypothetical protein NDN08_000568 [Rhodosorus marinus]